MKRDLKKAVQEFEKRYYSSNTEAAFYISDFHQIRDMSIGEYDAIFNALEAGFMIGYRKAQRDHRKQQQKQPIKRV